jgi:hypothetical protein
MSFVFRINAVYKPLFFSQSRYVLCYGGAGSGKSYFAAQKIVFRMLTESNHTILLVRNTKRSMKDSVFAVIREVLQTIGASQYFQFHSTTVGMVCTLNGNSIISTGCDDVEKLKSIAGITSIWIEEATEILESDFDQIDLRMRSMNGNYEQILLTFNPVDERHWIKKRFFSPNAKYSFDSIKTTYRDNESNLPTQYVDTLRSMASTNKRFFDIYANGEWGVALAEYLFQWNYYQETDDIPSDIVSVLYCDPNLALKSKGDKTAITVIGFSFSTQWYYILATSLQSYSAPAQLVETIVQIRAKCPSIKAIGFDGNVSQESTWFHLLRSVSRQKRVVLPAVDFCKYSTDTLAKNAQLAWARRQIFFPLHYSKQEESQEYLEQLRTFRTKKDGKPDDAPDSFICGFEFLHSRRLVRSLS